MAISGSCFSYVIWWKLYMYAVLLRTAELSLELFIIYIYWIYFLNVLTDHTYRYTFLKSCNWLKLKHCFSSDIHWLFFQKSFIFFIFTTICNAYYNFRNYILKSAIYLPVINFKKVDKNPQGFSSFRKANRFHTAA